MLQTSAILVHGEKDKNFLKFALLCLSHFPELVPLSLISSSYCYIQPPKPTISDKIVDTMTFSNPYYYSFISFSLVKSTYLPPNPPPKKKINNAILWFHELLAIYKQQWMGEAGLVNGLGCGRDSSIILNIVACYSLFQLLTLYPLCATHLQALYSVIPTPYTPLPNPIGYKKNMWKKLPHFVKVVHDTAYLIRITFLLFVSLTLVWSQLGNRKYSLCYFPEIEDTC